MLIPFRRERALTLRALALAATTTTAAPQGTTRRCADEQPSPTPCDSHANALPPMLPPPHPTPMQHLVLHSTRLQAEPAGQQQVLSLRAPALDYKLLINFKRTRTAYLYLASTTRSSTTAVARYD